MSTPIVLSAPFQHGPDDNYYLRQGSSDTIRAFEEAVGALEGGTALAFGSGMAAIAAIAEGQPTGAVAVVPSAGYSGCVTLFDEQQRMGRMQVRPVDITDTAAVVAGSQLRATKFTERWTLALDGPPEQPWRIAAVGAPVGHP